MLHFYLFGLVVVNGFLNMKLVRPHDKRTFNQFKESLAQYTIQNCNKLGFRKRVRGSQGDLAQSERPNAKIRVHLNNPYRTIPGDGKHQNIKLLAAEHCYTPRYCKLQDLNSELSGWAFSCKRPGCNRRTRYCCAECGIEACETAASGGKNLKPVSCICEVHYPKIFDIRSRVIRQ